VQVENPSAKEMDIDKEALVRGDNTAYTQEVYVPPLFSPAQLTRAYRQERDLHSNMPGGMWLHLWMSCMGLASLSQTTPTNYYME
jgi:hypothetical protein